MLYKVANIRTGIVKSCHHRPGYEIAVAPIDKTNKAKTYMGRRTQKLFRKLESQIYQGTAEEYELFVSGMVWNGALRKTIEMVAGQ